MTSRLEELNETSHKKVKFFLSQSCSVDSSFLIKDRELQELRTVINNIKEKNELGNEAPSRWKSDDNMLENNHNNKVSRSGSSRSFLPRKKNTWVN